MLRMYRASVPEVNSGASATPAPSGGRGDAIVAPLSGALW